MKKMLLAAIVTCIVTVANSQSPAYEWAKSMGAPEDDYGTATVIDLSGNVYTTGFFSGSADFDPGAGTYILSGTGMFVSKLDAYGNFVWAEGVKGCVGESIALDALGNIYVSGYFYDTVDFDPGAGVFNVMSPGAENIYVLKLDASGNFIKVACTQDGSSPHYIDTKDMHVDAAGDIYVSGTFSGTIDFNNSTDTFNLTSIPGSGSTFILKYDNSVNFKWVKDIKCYPGDYGVFNAIDNFGNIYTTSFIDDVTDVDPGPNVYNLVPTGVDDVFILKLNSAGNFVWAKRIGGTGSTISTSIAVDEPGNVYTTGYFHLRTDFNPGTDIFNMKATGTKTFISKLDTAGNFVWAKQLGGDSARIAAQSKSIKLDKWANIYIAGSFTDSADFDPGADTFKLTSNGSSDAYISKLDSAGNFLWAKSFGGHWKDVITSVAISTEGDIYTTGGFEDTVDFDPGSGVSDLVSEGYHDIFIQKLNHLLTGVQAHDNNKVALSIYPNPAIEKLTLDFDTPEINTIIEINNLIGQTIFTEELKNTSGKQSTTLDLSSLAKGVYFIRLKNKNGTSSKKFIKG